MPTSYIPSPSLVHAEPIYSTLASDPDLADLVEMFVDEIPSRVAALLESYESGNREQLGTLAHQLKGAAGSYGFDALTPAAARLETAVRHDESEEAVRQAIDTLVALTQRLRADAPSP